MTGPVEELDLVGVGAGPANLSVAALASALPALRHRFFDRQPALRWHAGLMLPGSVLQVSHLKDLVTLVDPTSPYTFLNFLAVTGRLHRFASLARPVITRREYESYLRWAAGALDTVEYGRTVREISFGGNAFLVVMDNGRVYAARHLSVGVGLAPRIPDAVIGQLGPTMMHSGHFGDAVDAVAHRHVAVVGGGQSGAEVVDHLLNLPSERATTALTWINRRPGLYHWTTRRSPTVRSIPTTCATSTRCPRHVRKELLDTQQMASDGVSADLLERVYRRLYENDFVDRRRLPVEVLPGRELTRVTEAPGGGWRLELTQRDTGACEVVRADTVVLATGYVFQLPDFLLPLADGITVAADGQLALDGDYSLPWDGPSSNKIFFLNAGRHSHGIADPNLSLASWRAATVLASITETPWSRSPHGGLRSSTSRWLRDPTDVDDPADAPAHPRATNRPSAPMQPGPAARTRATRPLRRERPAMTDFPSTRNPPTTRHLIVPSNPTPNGDLHIGHIAGPYLGADVLRRAALQRGEDAALLLGTAWQNTHVLQAARRQGREYLEVAAEFADRIEDSFARAGIGYDVFLRHRDIPGIEQATRSAFDRLLTDGTAVLREAVANYCRTCDDWRFQGYVDGRCPHCDSPDAYGIDCERCGVYHDDAELLDARCGVCAAPTTLRPLTRAFLELENRRDWFADYFAGAVLGAPVRRYVEAVMSAPLPSVAVSFIGEVGFPIDEHLAGQRIYPSFELAPRYTVMLRRLGGGQQPGPATGTARMSMLFGHDNAFERLFLFPVVLDALGDERAPQAGVLQMSYFYLLDGLKFSTSRRHVVSVHEMVAAFGQDTTRLYLAATRPEDATSDFRMAAVECSLPAQAVRYLRAWAETGDLPAGGGPAVPGPTGRPGLESAAHDMARALRAETLSCVRAADAIVRLAAVAAGPGTANDPSLRDDLLHCLVNGAAAVIPDTTALLRARFRTEPASFGAPGGD